MHGLESTVALLRGPFPIGREVGPLASKRALDVHGLTCLVMRAMLLCLSPSIN